jgi:hypothetical protein
VDAEDQKGIFKQIAAIQEVFESETECGLCKSQEVRYRVRTADDNEYYEIGCTACNGRFELGQHKKGGTLFPKRRGDDGKSLPNRGWSKYEPPANGQTNGQSQR